MEWLDVTFFEKLFPFLIGTVRTFFKDIVPDHSTGLFPFLIGTVRTGRSAKELAQELGFHSS